MSLPISAVDQVSRALSVASLRNEVIASNIANRDTQGYQRLKLSFAAALDEPSEVRIDPQHGSEPVSLEQDLVALSSNSAQYAALTRVLSRYFSLVSAITSYSRG